MNFTFVFQNTLYFCVSKSERGVAQSVARYVRDVGVAGSSLVTPTLNSIFPFLLLFFLFKDAEMDISIFTMKIKMGMVIKLLFGGVFQYKQTVVCQ